LPALVKEISRGTLRIDARATPLREVERAWTDVGHSNERVVLTP
jgi:hypothetical protein